MIYCDMDNVLVRQTGRKRWDLMGWMPDGRALWSFIAPLKPTLLSQLKSDVWEVSRHEKRLWVDRELGPDVPLIVVHADEGKHPHCKPGDILIDDDAPLHRLNWMLAGGIFIHHQSAAKSIGELSKLL